MFLSPATLTLLALALLVAVLLAILAAVGASLLARMDGASLPAALLRAGVAFGGTLTLLTALLALVAGVQPSQPERVVLTWQQDGSLAAAPVGETATAVLVATGFVQDKQTGIYRLSGDDTTTQARAVRETGRQLDAHGIDTALQHPSGRIAPAARAAELMSPRAWTWVAQSSRSLQDSA
ncbi:hypothetical protein ACFWNG_18390 [Streptomyces sp. NPDC058391]|uniref:hypothetical protein n=1 Tax=Streptomyces sp. NPDC058391 TaxID=3346476 RepID=UPI003647A4B4